MKAKATNQLELFSSASDERKPTEIWCDWHGRYEPVSQFNMSKSKCRCIKATEEKVRKRTLASFDSWGGNSVNPITGWRG